MSDARKFVGRTDYGVSDGDPLQKWLLFGIVFVIIAGISGVLYLLLGGFLIANTPRTLTESKLVTLKDVVAANPGSGPARRDYIIALLANGQTGVADAEYKKALKQMSDLDRTAVYDAGVTLRFYAKDYKGAVALAKTALADDDAARAKRVADMKAKGTQLTVDSLPSNYRISILVMSARASGALKEWKDAERSLTASLKYDPQASDILVLRGDVYGRMGKRDKAIADYRTALSFIPGYQPAVQGLKRLKAK